MTTETPSEAQERQRILDVAWSSVAWNARVDYETGWGIVPDEFKAEVEAAVRAEAMTEDARHWQEIAEGYLATLESVGEETGHLEASLAEAIRERDEARDECHDLHAALADVRDRLREAEEQRDEAIGLLRRLEKTVLPLGCDEVDHFALGRICDRHGIPIPCPFADARAFLSRFPEATGGDGV